MMLSEKRLEEIGQLAYADHKSFGSASGALVAVRLGIRDLLPEILRLRKIEKALLEASLVATEEPTYNPHECGYCGVREVEFELGDRVIKGGPRCVDAELCQERIDQANKADVAI
jgi:hypothetical protein